jgi:hypothetical protein
MPPMILRDDARDTFRGLAVIGVGLLVVGSVLGVIVYLCS